MVKTTLDLKRMIWIWSILVPCLFLQLSNTLYAQFSSPAGRPGSTAIHKDSAVFVGWATECAVRRAYIDISRPSLGYASAGDCNDAIGKAGEGGTLSLGDGGYAILGFDPPIANGPGWDFAVFENAFDDYFLELAFVEVSSDGRHFVRFPNTSLTRTDTQISAFGTLEAEKIHNLAGKYRVFYGVPFDLDTLKGSPGLDVNRITHVRVVDVVGSIDTLFASFDTHGNIINDPWPTPFPTGGFDLDAIGVIHQAAAPESGLRAGIRPSPASQGSRIMIQSPKEGSVVMSLFHPAGQLIYRETIPIPRAGMHTVSFPRLRIADGFYLLHVSDGKQHYSKKFIYLNQ